MLCCLMPLRNTFHDFRWFHNKSTTISGSFIIKVQNLVTSWEFKSAYGKKKIGAYYGDFGKWSKSVFRGFISMKLGFFGRYFPKSIH